MLAPQSIKAFPMQRTTTRLTLLTLAFLALGACSKSEPVAPAQPAAPEAPAAPAASAKPAFVGQGTIAEDQFKVLQDAKNVEQQTLDTAEKAREQMDQ
jgi:hypothetical protein